MKVLVTGGSGFIGSAVCRELEARGDTPVVLDRPNDIQVLTDIFKVGEGCEAVIHMAGVLGTHELFDEPYKAIDVNIKGSLNVLEFCRETGASYTGITMPQVFPSIYTATKVASTRLASAYHLTHGVKVSHVRAFNAFGPGQAHGAGHPQKIVPTFAVNAWQGKPIPVWGDGTQTVDLIHVDDLGRMLVDATNFGDDQTFDGGTGKAFTVNETIDMVQRCVPHAVWTEYLPMRRGEVPTHIVAEGEGWDLLGWRPTFRFEDLRETVLAYRTWQEH